MTDPKPTTTAFYLRVSTDKQTTENQLRVLEQVCAENGWPLPGAEQRFCDEGISGTKGRQGRPGFDRLCTQIERGQVRFVLVWSIDRLGRSLPDLFAFAKLVQKKRCHLYLHQERIDTATPMGQVFFSLCGLFSEMWLALHRERVKAGLARARAQGKQCSQFPKISERKEQRIRELRQAGLSIRAISRAVGVGHYPIQRVLRVAAC